MARIEFEDGTEVFTADEPVTAPSGKFGAMRAAARKRKAPNDGLTGRQRFERDIKKIVKGSWDYVSGDGDDFDRALGMLRGPDDEEASGFVLPDDD
jgi:hypothetical protein